MAQGKPKMNPNDYYNRMMTERIRSQQHSEQQNAAQQVTNLYAAMREQKARMETLSNAIQVRKKYESSDIIDAEFEVISDTSSKEII